MAGGKEGISTVLWRDPILIAICKIYGQVYYLKKSGKYKNGDSRMGTSEQ
ncbi:MAG: hypothetical protein LBR79_02150 [Oscillospiraceae bacterium]|jgi:hypothetical protein|nr:hypothetical protein [Oscillospiraceae bacterium]